MTIPAGADRRCYGADERPKRRHVDRAAAKRAARAAERRYGLPMRVYSCPGCLGYHVTTRKDGV